MVERDREATDSICWRDRTAVELELTARSLLRGEALRLVKNKEAHKQLHEPAMKSDDEAAAATALARISFEAYRWLRDHGQEDGASFADEPKLLAIDSAYVVPKIIWGAVMHHIAAAYDVPHELNDKLAMHLDNVCSSAAATRSHDLTGYEDEPSPSRDGAHLERARFEFARPFLGGDGAVTQLEHYILSCAHEAATKPHRYKFPYISIVQSSGFGKSRHVRELANHTKDDPSGAMRVLYTCVRPSHVVSSAFPQATAHLRDFLFPLAARDEESTSSIEPGRESGQSSVAIVSRLYGYAMSSWHSVRRDGLRRWILSDEMQVRDEEQQRRARELLLEDELAARLFRLYGFAHAQWDSVGQDWFRLFDDQGEAERICKLLEAHEMKSVTETNKTDYPRVLVLAIDEARYLLTANEMSINWFRLLRRALRKVAPRIRATFGTKSSIFGVLIDTNSKVANFVPPARQDLSSRGGNIDDSVLFPPFVLTHTADVRFRTLIERAKQRGLSTIQFYQELVATDYKDAWPALVAMGRPLWDRVKLDNHHEAAESSEVIQLAADKLLGGLNATRQQSLREDSLFGVASLLCRVGLRAFSWSPFASRTIAECMAVLTHVNFTHDQLLSTYSSDPVLTFGAARVWYQASQISDPHSTLTDYILPQLHKLLLQEVVDTGGVGELVSRILLLLVMDATGVVAALASDLDKNDRDKLQYAGEFRSVRTFFEVLHGSGLMRVVDSTGKLQPCGGVVRMLKLLGGWRLGFSHFVQLSKKPSKGMLWSMLARRAAGIFPRNCKGVDLYIPIFKGNAVSMIVVQVKNHAADDPAFPDSASIAMRPSFLDEFKPEGLGDVVRIYMSLRGDNATTRDQFYLVDTGIRHSERIGGTSQESYVLCLTGLGPWKATRRVPGRDWVRQFQVVSVGFAQELRKLLEPWWATMNVVEEDINSRGANFGMNPDAIRYIASRPLVDSLLTGYGLSDEERKSSAAVEPMMEDDEEFKAEDSSVGRKRSRTF